MSDLKAAIILTLERSGGSQLRVDKVTQSIPRLRAGQRVVKLTLVVPDTLFLPTPIPDVTLRIESALAAGVPAMFEQMPAGRALTDDEAAMLAKQCPDCPHLLGLHDEGGICRVSDCPCMLPDTVRAAERLGRLR